MGQRGFADFCSYFFLQLDRLVAINGFSGLVATNSIAQGDTREIGLDQLLKNNWILIRAILTRRWPGMAALEVAYLWMRKGNWQGAAFIEDAPVKSINSSLTSTISLFGKPLALVANSNKSFKGSTMLGMGFVLDQNEAENLIKKNPNNKEVILQFLNGEDIMTNFDQSPSRWAINFFDWTLESAGKYPDCLSIIKEKVKPERDSNPRKEYKENWWHYGEKRPALYKTIETLDQVLVTPVTTKFLTFTFQPKGIVYSQAVIVFAYDDFLHFTTLQSSFHEVWLNEYSSSLKTDQRYTPSDCFENFPFPINFSHLEEIGEKYYNHRQQIMVSRQEGLTKTYNRFHKPEETSEDIVKLWELHREMDEKVAAAYGWADLELGHGFHQTKQGLRYTISEAARREVLGRLLKLNHERHAEEVAQGLFDKGKKAAKPARKSAALPTPAPITPQPAKAQGKAQPAGAVPLPGKSFQQSLFEVEPPGSLWSQPASQDRIAADQPNSFQQFNPTPDPQKSSGRLGWSKADSFQLIPPEKQSANPANEVKPAAGPGAGSGEVRAWTGSVVTVREDAPGAEDEQFILISERESKEGIKTKRGYPALSIGTPLGMKLLDRKAGDTVSYKTPNGQVIVFKVISVGN